jgi:hypothetical protein
MTARLIGLASGVIPELSPPEFVEAAARGGFDLAGVWLDPERWTSAATRDVRARFRNTGIGAIDIELIWSRPGKLDSVYLRMRDVGAEVGAKNALLVSLDSDMTATRRNSPSCASMRRRLASGSASNSACSRK